MQTQQFKVLVKQKDEPGAGTYWAIVHSDNSINALSQAKALYGKLLVFESVMPVTQNG